MPLGGLLCPHHVRVHVRVRVRDSLQHLVDSPMIITP
jgi:hypothetical protein